MKLLVAADMHTDMHNLQKFYDYAKGNSIDLIVLLGDLFAAGEESMGLAAVIHGLSQEIAPLNKKILPLVYKKEIDSGQTFDISNYSGYQIVQETPNTAEYLEFHPDVQKELELSSERYAILKEKCEAYRDYLKLLRHHLRFEYHPIKNIYAPCVKPTLVIPGDHDLELGFTVLRNENIHLTSRTIRGLKIAGYGGAAERDGVPRFKGIPPELTTRFNEYPTQEWVKEGKDDIGHLEAKIVSEPRDFFEQAQPDIALLHIPLYGLMDVPGRLLEEDIPEEQKHVGSIPLRQYAQKGKTKVFLFGHVHDCQGVERIARDDNEFVVAINPGALGDTPHVPGGYFAELEIDDSTKEFVSAKFYEIMKGGGIMPNALYVRRGMLIDRIDIKGTTTAYAAIQQNPGSLIIQPSSDELRSEDSFRRFLEQQRRLKG